MLRNSTRFLIICAVVCMTIIVGCGAKQPSTLAPLFNEYAAMLTKYEVAANQAAGNREQLDKLYKDLNNELGAWQIKWGAAAAKADKEDMQVYAPQVTSLGMRQAQLSEKLKGR